VNHWHWPSLGKSTQLKAGLEGLERIKKIQIASFLNSTQLFNLWPDGWTDIYFFLYPLGHLGFTAVTFLVVFPLTQVMVVFFAAVVG
jgi:hypothetical protein